LHDNESTVDFRKITNQDLINLHNIIERAKTELELAMVHDDPIVKQAHIVGSTALWLNEIMLKYDLDSTYVVKCGDCVKDYPVA